MRGVGLISSEFAFNKGFDADYLEALHAGDEAAACAAIDALDPAAAGFTAYGGHDAVKRPDRVA